MDPSGACHSGLNDGGYLFMDQFGHVHACLDDGGFMYMDRQGSCHMHLNDAKEADSEHHMEHKNVHHSHRRRSAAASMMLGDLAVVSKPRSERLGHDSELRVLQSRSAWAHDLASHQQKGNTAARRSHKIGQPRRVN